MMNAVIALLYFPYLYIMSTAWRRKLFSPQQRDQTTRMLQHWIVTSHGKESHLCDNVLHNVCYDCLYSSTVSSQGSFFHMAPYCIDILKTIFCYINPVDVEKLG